MAGRGPDDFDTPGDTTVSFLVPPGHGVPRWIHRPSGHVTCSGLAGLRSAPHAARCRPEPRRRGGARRAPARPGARRSAPTARPTSSGVTDVVRCGRRPVLADLKQPAGRSPVRELVPAADILGEGTAPRCRRTARRRTRRLRRAESRARPRPGHRLGQEGPLARTPGHDLNHIGLTGALHAMGRGGAPPPGRRQAGRGGRVGAALPRRPARRPRPRPAARPGRTWLCWGTGVSAGRPSVPEVRVKRRGR
ncbi:CoA transferase [Streptomyces sp. NBC_00645]|uniref:CoA transferase n=1 Tax=Streptomyces sp. NBC_00645 TaxID=2975795 RepID=UPI00386A4622